MLGKTDPSKSEEAEAFILEGIRISESLKFRPLFSHGYLVLAELYADTGRWIKAMLNLLKAKKMFKEMGMDYFLAMAKLKP